MEVELLRGVDEEEGRQQSQVIRKAGVTKRDVS